MVCEFRVLEKRCRVKCLGHKKRGSSVFEPQFLNLNQITINQNQSLPDQVSVIVVDITSAVPKPLSIGMALTSVMVKVG